MAHGTKGKNKKVGSTVIVDITMAVIPFVSVYDEHGVPGPTIKAP